MLHHSKPNKSDLPHPIPNLICITLHLGKNKGYYVKPTELKEKVSMPEPFSGHWSKFSKYSFDGKYMNFHTTSRRMTLGVLNFYSRSMGEIMFPSFILKV